MKTYLKGIINNLKKSNPWKIQLPYEFIQECGQSFLSRYQRSLEVSMKGSDYKCHKNNRFPQLDKKQETTNKSYKL